MEADTQAAPSGKAPRTDRGRRTLRAILDAAGAEFAEHGFHDASISGITRRAGTALGSFYTYFDSKEAIFSALVRDMSESVAREAAAAMSPEATGIARESARLTQEAAADAIDVARTTIVAIEQGQRRVRLGELQKLAKAYGTSVNALMREEAIHVDLAPRFRKVIDSKDYETLLNLANKGMRALNNEVCDE